jgi:hypothetical protein
MLGIYKPVQVSVTDNTTESERLPLVNALVYISSLPEETGCLQCFVQPFKYTGKPCIQYARTVLATLQVKIRLCKV